MCYVSQYLSRGSPDGHSEMIFKLDARHAWQTVESEEKYKHTSTYSTLTHVNNTKKYFVFRKAHYSLFTGKLFD